MSFITFGLPTHYVSTNNISVGDTFMYTIELPSELVASIVALRKGKSEIIIGTILGSNVFNGVAIGAAIGILGPDEMIDAKIIGWLSALTILLAAVTWCLKSLSPKPVGKLAGFMLLSIYVFWLVVVGI